MPTKSKNADGPLWVSFGLNFLGSLIFLVIVFSASDSLLTGATGIWQPLLYAAAALGAITLFLVNFGNFVVKGRGVAMSCMQATMVTVFSLLALTAATNNEMLLLVTIAGFILCFVGSSLGFMM